MQAESAAREWKPGIYKGVKFADYLAIDACHNSDLKELADGKTPAHLYWSMTHVEQDREAFRVGAATHCAILEPERFAKEYVEFPKFDMRKTGDKAAAAEWNLKNADKIPLKADEWKLAVALSKAVWENPCAAELLGANKGINEAAVIWIDKATGLLCKARLDRFTTYHVTEDHVGWPTVIDVKTAEDASPSGFARAVVKFKYYWQAAFYTDGLATLDPRPRRFVFLVIEKAPPYCIAAYELDDTAMDEGRAQYRKALDSFAECQKSGKWPGYAVGINTLELPKWIYIETQPPV